METSEIGRLSLSPITFFSYAVFLLYKSGFLRSWNTARNLTLFEISWHVDSWKNCCNFEGSGKTPEPWDCGI
jgi:hypothetical protein